jgi:hypothetical protein
MATFVVSEKTRNILKNFAGIDNSIVLAPGKVQRTIAKGKSVLALAELPDAWPQETAIYDLNRFLASLSIYKNPTITFAETSMEIRDGGSHIGYRYSDPTTIQSAPNKTLPNANPSCKFTLTEAGLEQIEKAAALLELDLVSVVVENGRSVSLEASDAKNPASHRYTWEVANSDVELPAADSDFSRTLAFSTEHIGMLMGGAYEVSVGTWPYGYFQHKTEPVAYFIVAQI